MMASPQGRKFPMPRGGPYRKVYFVAMLRVCVYESAGDFSPLPARHLKLFFSRSLVERWGKVGRKMRGTVVFDVDV